MFEFRSWAFPPRPDGRTVDGRETIVFDESVYAMNEEESEDDMSEGNAEIEVGTEGVVESDDGDDSRSVDTDDFADSSSVAIFEEPSYGRIRSFFKGRRERQKASYYVMTVEEYRARKAAAEDRAKDSIVSEESSEDDESEIKRSPGTTLAAFRESQDYYDPKMNRKMMIAANNAEAKRMAAKKEEAKKMAAKKAEELKATLQAEKNAEIRASKAALQAEKNAEMQTSKAAESKLKKTAKILARMEEENVARKNAAIDEAKTEEENVSGETVKVVRRRGYKKIGSQRVQ